MGLLIASGLFMIIGWVVGKYETDDDPVGRRWVAIYCVVMSLMFLAGFIKFRVL